MIRNKRHIDLVYRYLDGDLADDELSAFRMELSENKDLQEELKFQELMNKIHRDQPLIDYYNQIEVLGEKYSSNKAGNRSLRLILFSSAAVIILIAASLLILKYTKSEQFDSKKVIAEYDELIDAGTYSRGNEDTLTDGFRAYDAGNYKEAVLLFTQELNVNPENDPALFFLGLSYFESGQYEIAAKKLEEIILKGNDLFYDAAEWKLALCYLQLDKNDEAIKLLNKIVENKQFKESEALEILNILK